MIVELPAGLRDGVLRRPVLRRPVWPHARQGVRRRGRPGGAFATARRLGPHAADAERWHDAWSALADTIAAGAARSADQGRRASARGAFLRAAEYHRQAYFFLRGDSRTSDRAAAQRVRLDRRGGLVGSAGRIGPYFAELRRYTMIDDAGSITCSTLLVESDHDPVGGGGPALLDALTCPKELVRLTARRGVDGHCGGLAQRVWAETVYDWLDVRLA